MQARFRGRARHLPVRRRWRTRNARACDRSGPTTPTSRTRSDRQRGGVRERLVGVARQPTDRMLAHFVSAIVAERGGDVLAAGSAPPCRDGGRSRVGPAGRSGGLVRVRPGRREPGVSLAHSRSARRGGTPDRRSLRAPRRSQARPQRSVLVRIGSQAQGLPRGRGRSRSRFPIACSGWPRRPSATSCAMAATRRSISPTSPSSSPSTSTMPTARDPCSATPS